MFEALVFSVVFVFGLVIGSFLNVVSYRLHTGRSLNGSSHCESCGHDLTWYELFPLLSYLVLGGRCRKCRSLIRAEHSLVELATGVLFVLAFIKAIDPAVFVFTLALISVLVVITVYDLRHMIIPDELSLALGLVALILSGYHSYLISDYRFFLLAILGGLVASIFYFSLWWFSAGKWIGLGDAKLAFGLGTVASLSGVFSLIVWSFWLGASVGLLLMLGSRLHNRYKDKKDTGVTMKTEIPFAPFLIASFILVYFFEANVLSLVESLYGNILPY